MPTVSLSIDLAAPLDEVWAVVGDFGNLDAWHPWVPACELAADGETRIMRAGEQVVAQERLLEQRDYAHVYTVDHGPFPMDEYRAELSAVAVGVGCRVTYRGTFEPTTMEVDVAAKLRRFFTTGFEALQARFGAG